MATRFSTVCPLGLQFQSATEATTSQPTCFSGPLLRMACPSSQMSVMWTSRVGLQLRFCVCNKYDFSSDSLRCGNSRNDRFRLFPQRGAKRHLFSHVLARKNGIKTSFSKENSEPYCICEPPLVESSVRARSGPSLFSPSLIHHSLV